MAIALALLPRWCASCGQRMHPKDPYAVTPDGGVGSDLVQCLDCARDADDATCETCSEPIEEGESVYHADAEYGCLPIVAYCDACDARLSHHELKAIRCAACAREEAE